MLELLNYIDGAMVRPAEDRWLDVVEPATGNAYARVPNSTGADIDRAVAAAKRAFPEWSATPAPERSRVLLRLADLIERDLERLAQAESQDTGKPISLARRVDIPRAAANFRFFATAILHGASEAHHTDASSFNYTLRQPRGVAGLISPWNLPLYLFSWKIAPALATGNTAVGKPSEITPYTAHLLAELATEAGFPSGVLNIVHGAGASAGATLIAHPDVPTISFTGGTATGRAIAQIAGPLFKRISLELGGKNPNIIFADADFDQAVETAARAAFTNQGQICLCGSRVLVERPMYERFVEALVERARALRPGDPMEDETAFGAITSKQHLEKIGAAVERAKAEGATVLCGGTRAEAPNARCAGGFFYQPTVLTNCDITCATQQEEIFGPVVTVSPFDDEAHAIAEANGVAYGLAAMIWTRDLSRAHRVAAALDAGIIWINCWMNRDLRTPFGGMKQSGVGREGGQEALRFFTEPKNVCVQVRG